MTTKKTTTAAFVRKKVEELNHQSGWEYMANRIREWNETSLTFMLNAYGKPLKGWELVTVHDGFAFFKRPL